MMSRISPEVKEIEVMGSLYDSVILRVFLLLLGTSQTVSKVAQHLHMRPCHALEYDHKQRRSGVRPDVNHRHRPCNEIIVNKHKKRVPIRHSYIWNSYTANAASGISTILVGSSPQPIL